MSRPRLALLSLVILLGIAPAVLTRLGGLATAAPVPTHLMPKRPSPYFPTTVGAKWVYESDGKEESEVVTAVEKAEGVATVTVRYVDPTGFAFDSQVRVSGEGLSRPKCTNVVHPPALLLKLPHTDGQRWESYIGAWGTGRASLVGYGPEEVGVPAGRFDAIRVEATFDSRFGEPPVEVKYWYAPGVGLVRVTSGTYERTLKSFAPGKE